MRAPLRKQPLLIAAPASKDGDVRSRRFLLVQALCREHGKSALWSFSAGHTCCQRGFQIPAVSSSEAAVGEAKILKCAVFVKRLHSHHTGLTTFAGNLIPAQGGASVPNRNGRRGPVRIGQERSRTQSALVSCVSIRFSPGRLTSFGSTAHQARGVQTHK